MKNTIARFIVATAIVSVIVAVFIYTTKSFVHVQNITIENGMLVVETSPTGRLADPYSTTTYTPWTPTLIANAIAAMGGVFVIIASAIFAIAHVLRFGAANPKDESG